MILMIDNYDSFTYNIVQYFMQLGEEVTVARNNEITIEEAEKLDFDYLILSPGPGRPKDAGCTINFIKHFAGKKPILGVCLGHQSIIEAFGGKIIHAKKVMHGKSDMVSHDGKSLFAGIPNPVRVIRYHSLIGDVKCLLEEFEVSGRSSDGEIMAIRHKTLQIESVQFHPESIGTEEGLKMLSNFINEVDDVASVKTLLKKVVDGQNLTEKEASFFMSEIAEGTITPAQIGSFLTALTNKGPTVEELTGFTKLLKKKARSVPAILERVYTDTCGTGGDGSGTFNISTAGAFVANGAGVNIAKHGNRSITSKSGSADVLETLGVKIDLTPEQAGKVLDQCGISFLFAPLYHPAFKNIMGPRRELGFRTVFNMMGPMLNPVGVCSQVMGVYSPEITELAAEVLGNVGVEHAYVVHGYDGLDEITLTDTTKITELRKGWKQTFTFNPEDYGYKLCKIEDLKGGDAKENAEITLRILKGEKGPKRDIVVLNTAAAIYTAGITDSYKKALVVAEKSIDSGAALKSLEDLIKYSNEV